MSRAATLMIAVEGLAKSFTLHLRGGVTLPVLNGIGFSVNSGECLALHGPSGSGKSTLLRCLYGNYLPQAGSISVRHGEEMMPITGATPQTVIALRRSTLGYVSQFLRVIPRVTSLDLITEPLLSRGLDATVARRRAGELLERLNIPERLWSLPPATFSGGEQQRINLARAFIADFRIMLLDEPTASLDDANRDVACSLIEEARERGAAIVGIFHDGMVRRRLASREFKMHAPEGQLA